MSGVEVVCVTEELRPVVRNLMQLYLYDFSELDGRDVDGSGAFVYDALENIWQGERHPYLFTVGGHWAGFAVVQEGDPHDMNEFFVLRKYRRSSVGRDAATVLFARHPGQWQIRQFRANVGATEFWRRILPAHEEGENSSGPVQWFTVDPAAP